MGHGHDAGHVVLLQTVLLLAEVAHQVAALRIVLGQDIEEEWLHVVVERLVIEEEFDEETEVLTVDLVGVAVHLEHGHPVLAVYLDPGRVPPRTLLQVALEDGPRLHVLETELAEEELGQPRVLLGVGARVPRADVKLPELNHLRGSHIHTSRTGTLQIG